MNTVQITSLDMPELSVFTKATENQLLHINEPQGSGVFIAESPYVISLALDAGYEPISVLCESSLLSDPVLCSLRDIPIYTADISVLKSITGFNLTQGMLCQMKRRPAKTPKELCKNAKRIAVLEHVMNPTNVGAVMRSAAALGIDALLLSADSADPLYRRAARVSMGTVFKLPWGCFDKNEPYKNIELLKDLGFKTVAMALSDDSISIDDKRITNAKKLAIVLGSEGEGLTKKTIKACDYTAKIPMQNGVDSLNVAAASAVIFWELGKAKSE